jgi:hypothetical protein
MDEPGSTEGAAKREGRAFFARVLDRVDEACLVSEGRLGLAGTAALVGLLWLALAAIYVTPATVPIGFGGLYVELSHAPFSLANGMGYRFLTPALGYLLLLRGELFVILPLVVAVAFLATIYGLSRGRGYSPGEAVGMAGLMALSAPTLFLLHFAGYTDTTSYLLLLLAAVNVKRSLWYTSFVTLALWNHEHTLLAIPWLLWLTLLAADDKRPLLRNCLGSVLAVALLFAMRALLEAHAEGALPKLTAEYYLDPGTIRRNATRTANLILLGIFQGFKLLWVLPLLAAWHAFDSERYGRCFFYVLVFASASAQMIFAHDTTRLIAMAFPAILLGAHDLRGIWGAESFRLRLWFLLGATCLFPQFYIAVTVRPFLPLPYSIMIWLMGGDPTKRW